MLMAPKYLAEVHTNPKIETTKKITQFINYSATYPDSIIEYIKSRMILHIYFDAS